MKWSQRGHRWAVRNLTSGNLVGCRAGGPLLGRTRKEARVLVKLNKMRDVEIIKVRMSFEEIKP